MQWNLQIEDTYVCTYCGDGQIYANSATLSFVKRFHLTSMKSLIVDALK